MPRGDYQRARGAATLAAVRAYYQSHPGCTTADCGRALGLTADTVRHHLSILRREWHNPSQSNA